MDTRQTDIALAHVNDAYSIATMSRDIIEQGLQWNWTPERVGRCVLSPDINVVTAKNDGDVIGFGIMFYGYSKRESNHHAREFYTRHGYAEIEVVPGYYQQKENAIRMSKCLQQGFYLSSS